MDPTTSITPLDKAACKRVVEEARPALEEVAARLGLTVKFGGGKFDPEVGTFSPKIEFAIDGVEERKFRADAWTVGLEPDDWHREFTTNGKRFRLVGVNPRAPKFALLVEEVATRKKFKLGVTAVAKVIEAR